MTDRFSQALSYLGEKPKTAKGQLVKKAAPCAPARVLVERAPQITCVSVVRLAKLLGVSEDVILNVSNISKRTFQKRIVKQEPLSTSESDRVLRIARVANDAERVFGDTYKARLWLSSPSRVLNAAPLELLATDAGTRDVEHELIRIDSGDFA